MHIFFDLDQTLWDFRKNSLEVIQRLFVELEFEKNGVPGIDDFIKSYKALNSGLWDQYRAGEISKFELNNNRFINTLKHYSPKAELLGTKMAELYIKYSPENVSLFIGAEDILKYLSVNYNLHVITNGFSEIQIPKLKNTGLDKYFKEIIFSEDAGCLKPDKKYFEYSIKKAGAQKSECLVIGDDPESDILGASNAGIHQVWFKQNYHSENTETKATYTIKDLAEIREIL
ncbi:MAG: YjjG family noncanonical pyrimidine nucleotidase [Bacteroidota bacterium]